MAMMECLIKHMSLAIQIDDRFENSDEKGNILWNITGKGLCDSQCVFIGTSGFNIIVQLLVAFCNLIK